MAQRKLALQIKPLGRVLRTWHSLIVTDLGRILSLDTITKRVASEDSATAIATLDT